MNLTDVSMSTLLGGTVRSTDLDKDKNQSHKLNYAHLANHQLGACVFVNAGS